MHSAHLHCYNHPRTAATVLHLGCGETVVQGLHGSCVSWRFCEGKNDVFSCCGRTSCHGCQNFHLDRERGVFPLLVLAAILLGRFSHEPLFRVWSRWLTGGDSENASDCASEDGYVDSPNRKNVPNFLDPIYPWLVSFLVK